MFPNFLKYLSEDLNDSHGVQNGTLEVVKALNYSMERERYAFLVVATDTGKPSSTAFTNVIVTVVDVNDHAPQFDRRNYSAIVPSSISAPYTIPLVSF